LCGFRIVFLIEGQAILAALAGLAAQAMDPAFSEVKPIEANWAEALECVLQAAKPCEWGKSKTTPVGLVRRRRIARRGKSGAIAAGSSPECTRAPAL
jgi:hypothetical protein